MAPVLLGREPWLGGYTHRCIVKQAKRQASFAPAPFPNCRSGGLIELAAHPGWSRGMLPSKLPWARGAMLVIVVYRLVANRCCKGEIRTNEAACRETQSPWLRARLSNRTFPEFGPPQWAN